MTDNICPCKPCVPPERHPGCHATCPKYKEWRMAEDAKAELMAKSKVENSIICDYEQSKTKRLTRKQSKMK